MKTTTITSTIGILGYMNNIVLGDSKLVDKNLVRPEGQLLN